MFVFMSVHGESTGWISGSVLDGLAATLAHGFAPSGLVGRKVVDGGWRIGLRRKSMGIWLEVVGGNLDGDLGCFSGNPSD